MDLSDSDPAAADSCPCPAAIGSPPDPDKPAQDGFSIEMGQYLNKYNDVQQETIDAFHHLFQAVQDLKELQHQMQFAALLTDTMGTTTQQQQDGEVSICPRCKTRQERCDAARSVVREAYHEYLVALDKKSAVEELLKEDICAWNQRVDRILAQAGLPGTSRRKRRATH